MKRTYARTIAAVLAIAMWAVASSALAGDYYAGLSIGSTTVDICGDASDIGLNSCDDTDTGWRLLGGWNINDNFAVEGSYTDAGQATASALGVSVKAEATAWTISVKAQQALNDMFSVFGRLGYAHWKADLSGTAGLSASDDGNDLNYGVGLQYTINEQFGVRGEWERTDADGTDVDMLSIGVTFSF